MSAGEMPSWETWYVGSGGGKARQSVSLSHFDIATHRGVEVKEHLEYLCHLTLHIKDYLILVPFS